MVHFLPKIRNTRTSTIIHLRVVLATEISPEKEIKGLVRKEKPYLKNFNFLHFHL